MPMRCSTRPVRGSIRSTRASPCTAQIDPAPTATPPAPPAFAGSGIGSTEPYLGSTRSSVGASASVTQTEPSPTASPPACTPRLIRRTTACDCGSICSSVPSALIDHRYPSPKRSSAVLVAGTCPSSAPLDGSRNAIESGSARASAGSAESPRTRRRRRRARPAAALRPARRGTVAGRPCAARAATRCAMTGRAPDPARGSRPAAAGALRSAPDRARRERAPGVGERLERLSLSAGAVEREHQLRSQLLPHRVLLDQRGEFAGHLAVASECEIGIDASLERDEPALFEPRDLALGEIVVREIGERRPAPEREPVAEHRGRGSRRGLARSVDELLEAVDVERLGRELQNIAARAGDERVGPERLAQLRDVALERLRRRVRSLLAPEVLDEALARDELVGVQQQDREQLALPPATDRDRSIAIEHLEWAEEPDFHVAPYADATTAFGPRVTRVLPALTGSRAPIRTLASTATADTGRKERSP